MQKRHIVWCFLVLQMACVLFLEMNMNIAIVSMINVDYRKINTTAAKSIEMVCPNATSFSKTLFGDTIETTPRTQTGFPWSKAEQHMILSGSSWLAYISIPFGGILAQKFGSTRVIGINLLTASIMSSLIPICAHLGPVVVSCIRAFKGLFTGMIFPGAFSVMVGRWSPPQERGRFEISSYVGASIGTSVANLCFGYISQYLHWKYVFYLCSIYGVTVNVLWFVFIHDSPDSHPTISFQEKKYIKDSIGDSFADKKDGIPWKKIFTNKAVIICTLGYMPGVWLYRMPKTYLPIYFKTIFDFDANKIGILASIWRVLALIAGLIGGYLSDIAIKKGLLSITNTRKVCTFIGCILAAVPLLMASRAGCDVDAVILYWTVYSVLQVFTTFGTTSAFVDISPQYCGIIIGIAAAFGFGQYFLFSLLINYFTGIWKPEVLWKNVFAFSALYVIALNAIFVILGTSKVQHWNSQKVDKPVKNNVAEVDSMIKSMS